MIVDIPPVNVCLLFWLVHNNYTHQRKKIGRKERTKDLTNCDFLEKERKKEKDRKKREGRYCQ